MLKRKGLLVLLVIVMLFGIQMTASAKNVTIKYGIWDVNQQPILQEIAEKFMAENPEIKVEVEVTPWGQYWTKLQTAATGGALPDLFWMNGVYFEQYASNGVLMPLTEFLSDDDFQFANFPESLVNLYTYEGQKFGVPKDFDTIGLFYNTELFDKAGIPYPDESWDWDKFVEAADRLTDLSNGIYGFASARIGQQNYYNTIYQNGGYVIDGKRSGYIAPATIEGIEFLVDLIHKHKVSPTLAQMTDTDPLDMFSSGKAAMLYGGSWYVNHFMNTAIAGKFDCAPLPKGKKRASIIHGLGNVMAANSSNKAEAWEFLKFLGSKEAAEIMADAVIPAYNNTQQAWVDKYPELNLDSFIDAVEYSVPLPVSVNTIEWWNLETEYLNKVWAGEMSVEEACSILAQEMNQVLANE